MNVAANRFDELRESIPALVDLAAAAELFGVGKGTVQKWRTRGIFPDPDVELAVGPIWLAEVVVDWGLNVRRVDTYRPRLKVVDGEVVPAD